MTIKMTIPYHVDRILLPDGYKVRYDENDYHRDYIGVFKDNKLIKNRLLSPYINPREIVDWINQVIQNDRMFAHIKF